MNAELMNIFNRSIEIFKQDPRILGAWQFGSVSKNRSDDYSDVDPVFLVKKEYFDQVDQELPEIFKNICPDIRLWWPESYNGSTLKNYAVLLKGNDLHQYDLTIVKESCLDNGMAYVFSKDCREEHIIFDKEETVKNTVIKRNLERERAAGSAPITPDGSKINNQIEMYWLFAFISVKYFMRKNIFKIIYARDMMRSVHLSILQSLIGKGDWSWWAESITVNLDAQKQSEMLSYFGAPTIEGLKNDFRNALSNFSKDAGELCAREGLTYPNELEDTLLKYIETHLNA